MLGSGQQLIPVLENHSIILDEDTRDIQNTLREFLSN
jgi:hypothetical protein